ncbi:hypothetical protein EV34_14820, partial [Staphylococcus aureus]
SQEAQETQEDKKEAQSVTEKSAAVSNEESKSLALKAHQASIKGEASSNNLSSLSQEGQGGSIS